MPRLLETRQAGLQAGFLPSFFEKSVDQGTTTECRDYLKPAKRVCKEQVREHTVYVTARVTQARREITHNATQKRRARLLETRRAGLQAGFLPSPCAQRSEGAVTPRPAERVCKRSFLRTFTDCPLLSVSRGVRPATRSESCCSKFDNKLACVIFGR